MQQATLSNEEKRIVKRYGEEFKKWLDSENGKKEMEDHLNHENYFKSNLSSENLSKITKSDFVELYKNLWASNIWENKDWNINLIIEKNGLDNLKNQFSQLLYGTELFEKRYDSFREKIKGFGISAISEIFNMVYPEKYCLWNNKTKSVLDFLNLRQNLPERLFKYNFLTGDEYSQAIDYLKTIKDELSEFGVKDFVDLDLFFWFIYDNIMPKHVKKDSNLIIDEQNENELQNKKAHVVDLEKLILEYDKNKEYLGKRKITEKEAMELRSRFISDFPQDKILELDIDRYVFGATTKESSNLDESTFCFRLEFRLPGFGGIRGTPATKFGIYYDRKTQKYRYDETKFRSPEECFKKILTEIDYLLKGAKQFCIDKDWNKMSDIFEMEYNIQTHVRSKILSVYYPEHFALIHVNHGIKGILVDLFKIPEKEIKDKLLLNHAKLLEIKQDHPVMKNWTNFDYSTFVWRVWKNYFVMSDESLSQEKFENVNQLKTGFWIVRAGSVGDEKEKEVLENNVVTINWGAGDLSRFSDRHSLKSEFAKLSPGSKEQFIETISSELWNFSKEIKKGDIAILPQLSKDSKHDVAIGQVTDVYEYRHDLPKDINNTLPVIWLHKNIPRSEFTKEAKESFSRPLTVYRIKKPAAIKSIVETMKKYNILPKEMQQIKIDIPKSIESQIKAENSISALQNLAEVLFIPYEKLKVIEELLAGKKQIIFYGPPGTSKTFVAKKISEYFVKGKKENVGIVQFHPSYSYEDFVEGIKPMISTEGQATGFIRQNGIFKNLVEKCITNPSENFVLIIDEINRGNISKIFGELIYLLEYRNEKIRLTYSPNEEFYIPDNLYIIGTMNSADRSIAFVDYALRRRFYFIDFYPDGENQDILKKWFIKNRIKEGYQVNVLDLMKEINIEISNKLGREYQIGYSYFMHNLNYEKVKRIIDYAIVPLIEQYFFGKKESVGVIRNICNTYLIRLQDFENGKESSFSGSLESFSSQM